MSGRETTVLVSGDINIQDREDPKSAFALVKEQLQSADLRIGNCEMCLSSPEDSIPTKRPVPTRSAWLQSDARMVEALVWAGFDMVTTANNVNYGQSAILKSIETLDANGIVHTGTGRNISEARRPAVATTPDGTRVGLLGYTCVFHPRDHAATECEPGVAALVCHTAYEPHYRVHELPGAPPITRSWPDQDDLGQVRADVERLRETVDILITYFHMGVSSQEELTEYQKLLGHAAVDFGADLVCGASAHVPQAIEVYKGKPIFYGLGNFAFDWWFLRETRRHGLLVECGISNHKLTRLVVHPVTRTRTPENQVEVLSASSTEGRLIMEGVERLSKEFGTSIVVRDGKYSIAV